MNKKKKISFSFLLRAIGVLLVAVFMLSILWVAYYSKFEVGRTPQMAFYKFNAATDSLHYKVEYQWVPLDSVSRNLIVAVLAAQDKNFYVHDGLPPIEETDTITTIVPNQHETITQKAAHSVFLTAGDSWIKKILEPYFSLLEEYLWGKNRILEIYLNTAIIGNGIFGVEAASQIYFNKPAGDLTINESALIAAMMELPENFNQQNPDEKLLLRQKQILLDMALMMHIQIGKKPIDEKEYIPAKPIYKRKWRG